MKGLIAAVLFTGAALCNTAAFSPTDHWLKAGEEGLFTNYLDMDDMQYNRVREAGSIWVKSVWSNSKNSEYYVQQYAVDYKNKRMKSSYFTMYRNGTVLSKRAAVTAKMYSIAPDSWQEKAVNLAAAKMGRPSLYGGASQWQWVPSSGNEQVYIDHNSIEIDRNRRICYVWALLKPEQMPAYSVRYKCNFATGTIGLAKYLSWPHMFPPKAGTQQAVYTAAKELFGK